jgi:hypothetical protein
MMRMPADWWDSPAAVVCSLSRGPQSARAARRLTRNTMRDWGLAFLAEDAVTHATTPGEPLRKQPTEGLGLRLFRRTGEVICAVLDSSDSAPVLKAPGSVEESGRGLQMVDALSDVWGWSPVAGRGKAVWAILFCA